VRFRQEYKNIGIYYFSYARSIKEAEKEANVCLDIINPYKKNINMPIAFDWEDDSYRYCIKYKITPTRKLCDRHGNRQIHKQGNLKKPGTSLCCIT